MLTGVQSMSTEENAEQQTSQGRSNKLGPSISIRVSPQLLHEWETGLESHGTRQSYVLRELVQSQLEIWKAEEEGLSPLTLFLDNEIISRLQALARTLNLQNVADLATRLLFQALARTELETGAINSSSTEDMNRHRKRAIKALQGGENPLEVILTFVCDVLPVRDSLRDILERDPKKPKPL